MPRPIRLAILIAAGLVVGPVPVLAGNSLVVPRPPTVLSPDVAGPQRFQVKPGEKPELTDPAPRKVTSLPVHGTVFSRRISAKFLPRTVGYAGKEPPGTVIIDTNRRYLYLVLESGKARRYGVGVGRPGFEWAGTRSVTAKAEWPGWTPPEEMRERQPDLPESMAGGPDNPLGARALYLGDTLYRIHGSNEPWTIGHAVSSGCIRMRNEDVIELYDLVKVGTRVIVL